MEIFVRGGGLIVDNEHFIDFAYQFNHFILFPGMKNCIIVFVNVFCL